MMYLIMIIAALFSILLSNNSSDPKFQGPNITHQAIVAADIKSQKIGSFEMMPVGEHSVVFAFDHKKFAKITADKKNFVLVLNPANVPAKYKTVTKVEGNFDSNIQDSNDIKFSK